MAYNHAEVKNVKGGQAVCCAACAFPGYHPLNYLQFCTPLVMNTRGWVVHIAGYLHTGTAHGTPGLVV
jgi:hypothetical protein